ncbi:MAG: PKD domain-containing protein, partial [Bacteroidota bacterium]
MGYGQCSVNAGNDTTICRGASFTRTATTPVVNPNFKWYLSGNPGTTLSTTASINISPSSSGVFDYVVEVTSGSCTITDIVKITVNTLPSVSISANPNSICPGGTTTLTASGADSYTWSPSSNLSSTSGASVNTLPASSQITYSVVGLNNATNCSSSANTTINIKPAPISSFTYSPNTGCPKRKRKLFFTSTAQSNGTGNLTYSWNFGDPNSGSKNTSTDNNPEHSFIGNGFNTTGTFVVTLTVTGQNGCSSTSSQTIS